VSHTYPNAGTLPHTFTATLTVTDDVGTRSHVSCASIQDALNEPPVATDNTYATDEDTPVSGNVLTDGTPDSDPDSGILTAVLVTAPAAGTVQLSADGTFTYTPVANFHGTDSFTYQAVDTEAATAVATVTVQVAPVNDAPVGSDDAVQTDEDVAVSGDVLANDSDIDGDTLTATLLVGPAHGVLALNTNGTFTFTPVADFHGADGFTYQVADGAGGTSAAAVAIVVAPVNDAPVAQGATYTTIEGEPLTGNVLATASDVDGDQLTSALVTGPAHGVLVLDAGGDFTYTAGVGFVGPDSFVYRVLDGQGGTADAMVTIEIGARNRPPVCTAARPTIALLWPANGRLVAVGVLGVTDPDGGDVVSIRIEAIRQDEPPNTRGARNTSIDGYGVGSAIARLRAERSGTARAPGNGRVYHVSFTATDSAGASCSGTVRVGVPHDRGRRAVPVDDGPRYSSTGGTGGRRRD
jgi:VCBS repeat-containing protein